MPAEQRSRSFRADRRRHDSEDPMLNRSSTGEGLMQAVADWVSAGLISAEQGDAILTHEAVEAPSSGPSPVLPEIFGYLGGSLALVAAILAVAQFWAELESWARLLLVATATAVLVGAGAWIRSSDERAFRRLSAFLWFLSSGGVAFFVGLLANDPGRLGPEDVTLAVGLTTAGYSAVLWRVGRSALQHVVVFASLVACIVGALMQFTPPPAEFIGLGIWGFGLAWGILAWGGLVPPERLGYVAAGTAILGGALAFGMEPMRDAGLALGVASAVLLIAVGATLREPVLLGFGAAGVFVFVPQLVFRYFGETLGAPIALFLTGVALLATGVGVARLRGRVRAPGRHP